MPEIVLDDGDRALLGQCPFTIFSSKRNTPTKAEAARMRRIKRLWSAGKVRGDIEHGDENGYVLRVTLTDAGRREIGLLPREPVHAA